jgi:hypothetical protein
MINGGAGKFSNILLMLAGWLNELFPGQILF